MAVVFYGEFSGASSFPVVCRAITRWLVTHGRSVSICDLQPQSCVLSADLEQALRGVPRVTEYDRELVLSRMGSLQRGELPSRDDIVTNGLGLLFAFPGWAWACPPHKPFIGYHVCDTDQTPNHWPAAMNEVCDIVLTPSKWCASVFKSMGVEKPIHVVRHGIDPDVFHPAEGQTYRPGSAGRPRVLRFFCSSETGNRKGLHETIAAFRSVHDKMPGKVQLVVRGTGNAVRQACADVPGVVLERGDPVRPAAMAQMLRETDLLLVPSRAEGFGLQALESVAVGTPVVATDCTGMSEWAHTFEGVRWVETGDMAPCLPGYGRAPALDPGHLADVIENAVRDLPALRGAAFSASPTVRRKWSWEKVLAGSALERLTE